MLSSRHSVGNLRSWGDHGSISKYFGVFLSSVVDELEQTGSRTLSQVLIGDENPQLRIHSTTPADSRFRERFNDMSLEGNPY